MNTQSEMRFDGATYEAPLDHDRLAHQTGRVFSAMKDSRWRTLAEIAGVTGAPEASVSARLRDLRKQRFGGHTVNRRRRSDGGLHEYQFSGKQGMKAKVQTIFGGQYGAMGQLMSHGRPNHAELVHIETVLEDVKYRDWEWVLFVNGDMVTIGSTFEVPDSAPPHGPVRLTFFGPRVSSDYVMPDAMIVDFAWRCVRDFALHEAAEWFYYKGAMIHDPHKHERVPQPASAV